ncbi:MAG: citrate synthase [Deltaproteobacteria bacterium]|nr:citrate synthase [Deltaproteobacteria bacterium]
MKVNEKKVSPSSVIGTASIDLMGETVELPIVEGSEGERAIDIRTLRKRTGYITLDDGYTNTGSCESAITFVNGEDGILRYGGYPIEQIARSTTFPEVALLLLQGAPPPARELKRFSQKLTEHAMLHEGLRHHFVGFPPEAHPMAILSAMINSVSCYHPDLLRIGDEEHLLDAAAKLLSKVRTIAAFSYKKSLGEPMIYPDAERGYVSNFLHMMFSKPYTEYEPSDEEVRAIQLFFILHADHEQNCSTATARMVGSSGANLFASVAAAVCALWGPLHGGANTNVIKMLEKIHEGGDSLSATIDRVKRKEELLWGFGHRVYKSSDPRVKLLRKACHDVFQAKGISDPLLDIAQELEQIAVKDDYFVERKLYPNVDFYSGILLRAIGIPLNMYTVMFAIGRMPGWIANWAESWRHGSRIHRPRQIYTGSTERDFVPIDRR